MTRERFLRLEHKTHECWAILCDRFLEDEEEFCKEVVTVIEILNTTGHLRSTLVLSYCMARLCQHSAEVELNKEENKS